MHSSSLIRLHVRTERATWGPNVKASIAWFGKLQFSVPKRLVEGSLDLMVFGFIVGIPS